MSSKCITKKLKGNGTQVEIEKASS